MTLLDIAIWGVIYIACIDCLRNVARSSNGGTCEILTAIHNNGYLGPKAIDGIAAPGNALLMSRVDGITLRGASFVIRFDGAYLVRIVRIYFAYNEASTFDIEKLNITFSGGENKMLTFPRRVDVIWDDIEIDPPILSTDLTVTIESMHSVNIDHSGVSEIEVYTQIDPVAMYYLSATSEGADLTDYHHPMTLTGLTYTQGPLGESLGAAQFAGATDSVGRIDNILNSELSNTGSFSMLFQVFSDDINSVGAGMYFTYHLEGPFHPDNWASIFFEQNGNVYFRPNWEGNLETSAAASGSSQWMYLAGVFDKSTRTTLIYKDGVLEQSSPNAPLNPTHAPSEYIDIGSRENTDRFFSGKMSCLQFYNRALDLETVIKNQYRCQEQLHLDVLSQNPYWPVNLQTVYYRIDTSVTFSWTMSKFYCESLGGQLATFQTVEEQQQIQTHLSNAGITENFWMQGTRAADDETWIWLDSGESLTADLLWKNSYPSATDGHDYLYIDGSDGHTLANLNFDVLAVPLCQKAG